MIPQYPRPRLTPKLKSVLLGGAAVCALSLALTAPGAALAAGVVQSGPVKTWNGSYTAKYDSSQGGAPVYIDSGVKDPKTNQSIRQITLNGPRTILDWTLDPSLNGYLVTSYDQLNFYFQKNSDIVVNRVTSGPATIGGKISGFVGAAGSSIVGGNIWFLDPYGLNFSTPNYGTNPIFSGPVITAGGFLAAAANFADDNAFLAGSFIQPYKSTSEPTKLSFVNANGTVNFVVHSWTTYDIETTGLLGAIGSQVSADDKGHFAPETLKSSSGTLLAGVGGAFSLTLKTMDTAGDLDLLAFQIDQPSTWQPQQGYVKDVLDLRGLITEGANIALYANVTNPGTQKWQSVYVYHGLTATSASGANGVITLTSNIPIAVDGPVIADTLTTGTGSINGLSLNSLQNQINKLGDFANTTGAVNISDSTDLLITGAVTSPSTTPGRFSLSANSIKEAPNDPTKPIKVYINYNGALTLSAGNDIDLDQANTFGNLQTVTSTLGDITLRVANGLIISTQNRREMSHPRPRAQSWGR